MKDQFLYDAAPAVRQDFARALYDRISQPARSRRPSLRWIGWNRRTLAYAAGFVLVTAIVGACAREILRPRYVQVGEMWVLEGIPSSYVWHFEIPARDALEFENVLSHGPDPVSIGQAIEALPYPLALPRWLPDGYSLLQEEVRPPLYPDWFLSLTMMNQVGERVVLWVYPAYNAEIRVPRGMWGETSVGGSPAVLVRGRFPLEFDMGQLYKPVGPPIALPTPGSSAATVEIEHRWNVDAGLGLTWLQGGATLHLQTYGEYLSEEELVRIAESMHEP